MVFESDFQVIFVFFQKVVFLFFKFHSFIHVCFSFLGWYFKAVTPEGESFIVIPGNFYGNTSTSKENHAFIMVLHGDEMDTFRFPNQEFKVIEHQVRNNVGDCLCFIYSCMFVIFYLGR